MALRVVLCWDFREGHVSLNSKYCFLITSHLEAGLMPRMEASLVNRGASLSMGRNNLSGVFPSKYLLSTWWGEAGW